jgi:hypothetical protein
MWFYEECLKGDINMADGAILTIKFINVDTGEIIEIDAFDDKAFNECMSHKNYKLIFG